MIIPRIKFILFRSVYNLNMFAKMIGLTTHDLKNEKIYKKNIIHILIESY